MNQIKIGEFIKSLRKAKGLSQQEVADALLVTQKTVSRWENGEGIPDISIIKDVASFFEVSVDELLDGERKNKEQSSSTYKRKEIDRSNIIANNLSNSLNIFLMVGLGIYGLLLLIGIILLFTIFNELIALLLSLIGAITCFIIYFIGYKNNINKMNEDLEYINKEYVNKQIRLKNLMFSDIFTVLNIISLSLIFFILFIFIHETIVTYFTIINFLCLLVVLTIIYIGFRPLIKDGKIDNKDLSKNLNIIFGISMICVNLLLFESKLHHNDLNVYAEYNYLPSLFMLSVEGAKTSAFRIIGLILSILSIGGIIYFTKKNQFLYNFITASIGFLGSFFCILDHHIFSKKYYYLEVRIDEIGINILFIAIAISIYNLIKYIKNKKKKVENHE